MTGVRIFFLAFVVAAALLSAYLVWRHRRNRAKLLIGEILEGYFEEQVTVEQVGERARQIASRNFLGGPECFALTHSAFQQAAEAALAHGYSREIEQRLLSLSAAVKSEFGLPERYRIEGWRAGRE